MKPVARHKEWKHHRRTIGRINGVDSFVREYFCNTRNIPQRSGRFSRMTGILGIFSALGDSAIIADANGQVGGIITGNAGQAEALDVTLSRHQQAIDSH
ncbi:hypothetical protein E4T56_gene4103 [Termitomyces sp. T112]|nr:hypothetical protein E4T56_gene4103 [Termitomyces sp. T112]